MAPRTEFIVLATLAGGIVAVLGYLLASAFVFELQPVEALRLAAQWSPAGIAAAFGAAWIASAWQRRARDAGRAWTARAMALRATGLALLLYPLTVACWTDPPFQVVLECDPEWETCAIGHDQPMP